MEASIKYLDGVRFEASSRGHKVVCDQPQSNGGNDSGMTPPEFMLVSLGACAGFYAAQYLKARSLPTEGLEVHVHAGKASQPARLGSFHIEVDSPVAGDERHREGLLRAVKTCLIHNTLIHPPVIEIAIGAPALV
jgi:putative redox protein